MQSNEYFRGVTILRVAFFICTTLYDKEAATIVFLSAWRRRKQC